MNLKPSSSKFLFKTYHYLSSDILHCQLCCLSRHYPNCGAITTSPGKNVWTGYKWICRFNKDITFSTIGIDNQIGWWMSQLITLAVCPQIQTPALRCIGQEIRPLNHFSTRYKNASLLDVLHHKRTKQASSGRWDNVENSTEKSSQQTNGFSIISGNSSFSGQEPCRTIKINNKIMKLLNTLTSPFRFHWKQSISRISIEQDLCLFFQYNLPHCAVKCGIE